GIADAIRRFLAPIVEAIQALQRMIDAALEGIRRAVQALRDLLAPLKTTLQGIRDDIHGAFQAVADIFHQLDLKGLVDGLRGGIDAIVAELHKVQLTPYFETAGEICDAGATAIGLVPFSLLPADKLDQLRHKGQPIKDIDYEVQVHQLLKGQMDGILAELDGDILREVEEAYHHVVEFLDGINPRSFLEGVEARSFDPLVERIRAVDVDAL